MTRRRDSDKAKYFGPYTSTATAYGIISAMQKTFGLPSCRRLFPRDRGRVSSCVYKQLGCVAPCDPNTAPEAYREAFSEAVSFLSGNYNAVIAALTGYAPSPSSRKNKRSSQIPIRNAISPRGMWATPYLLSAFSISAAAS